jgi:hypothetical protein
MSKSKKYENKRHLAAKWCPIFVNVGAYMNFKRATDDLFTPVSHTELAEALNISVASIRQARLKRTARAYRAPPIGWHNGVARLAQRRIAKLHKLIAALKTG